MKTIGVVGRYYFNKDNQKIIQVNDKLIKALYKYDDVSVVVLCSTLREEDYYKTKHLLDFCDAFILPGGSYFDSFDEYVLDYAINHDKPLLGICLGFQAMCSHFAKVRDKLDMTTLGILHPYGEENNYIHENTIVKNTKLYNIVKQPHIKVNSLHHDIVNFEMPNVTINSISSDDVIEGVEIPNKKFIIGLQWHPEYLQDNNSIRIFDAFIEIIMM